MKTAPSQSELTVLMITYLFPPWFAGGSRQALELATGLLAQGVKTIFVAANFGGAKSRDSVDGFPVCRLKARRGTRLGYLTFAFKSALTLLRLRNRSDLVLLHSTRPFTFLTAFTAKLLCKPVLLTMTLVGNDDPVSLSQKSFLWRFERLTFRFADRLICKSTAIFEACKSQSLPLSKLCRIANGVNPHKFAPARPVGKAQLRKQLDLPENDFIFVFAGRISVRKGCDTLLQAWKQVYATQPNALLLLLGPYEKALEGSEENERFSAQLKQWVDDHKHRRVRFQGSVTHEEISRYFRAADCLVFPSRREGLPNVILEAMASGLPVICSHLPGITDDIIEHGADGLIVSQNDQAALAENMIEIMHNEQLRETLRSRAAQKIRSSFAIEKIAASHAALYHELLGRDPGKLGLNGSAPKAAFVSQSKVTH